MRMILVGPCATTEILKGKRPKGVCSLILSKLNAPNTTGSWGWLSAWQKKQGEERGREGKRGEERGREGKRGKRGNRENREEERKDRTERTEREQRENRERTEKPSS
jgi:hypothetical protein